MVLVRAAIPDGGRTGRLLRRAGVPDQLLSLLAATPSLRASWLLSVAGVLAAVAGEAVLAQHGWVGPRPVAVGSGRGWTVLAPFLLITPLLTLAGVAAAFQPRLDPAWRLAAAAPFSGFTLLLVRALCALATALILAAAAAFAVPGPGWLPAALLLPSLALCALALAAATVVGPVTAAVGSAALWTGPVLALTLRHPPLVAVQWPAQAVCLLALAAAAAVLFLRRDRFEPRMDDMTLNRHAAAVTTTGLSRSYGPTRALDQVDLTLAPGITGLLGPNGAGKTTLLSVLATVSEPDAGQVSVLGLDPREPAERVEIRRRLGYLPQELGYHRHFTVAAFLDYVAILKEITGRRERAGEVARVLADTDLERYARHRIRTLSGGMRQRVGIAQALLGQPGLLVLDEPTAGLDPEQRLRFRELLSSLPGDPVIMLSTHQADDIAAICAHVIVLLQGQVRFAGTPAELAATAAGKVWTADGRYGRAHLSWRGSDGRWRHIGDHPPDDVELGSPTVEDGYLLLSHAAGAR